MEQAIGNYVSKKKLKDDGATEVLYWGIEGMWFLVEMELRLQ